MMLIKELILSKQVCFVFSEQKLESFSVSNVPILEWLGQKSVILCTFGASNETQTSSDPRAATQL